MSEEPDSLRERLGLLRARHLTAVEVAEQFLSQINAGFAADAFVAIDEPDVLAQARRSDWRLVRGSTRPLEGIPVAVKDLIAIRHRPMRAGGNRVVRIPRRDSDVVASFRRLGCVIAGRTELHELAFGTTGVNRLGTPLNPRHPELIPGGSSSGSAAVVAAALVPVALGTDTGGSVRIPATCCEIVGFKPTYGLLSTRGVLPLARSMDHVGLLTRTAEDLATIWNALADPVSSEARRLRVGLIASSDENTDPIVAQAFDMSLDVLRSAGAQIQKIAIGGVRELGELSTTVLFYEAYRQHGDLLEHSLDNIGLDVRERLEAGRAITRSQYMNALRQRRQLSSAVDDLWSEVDLLVSPTLPETPLPLADVGDSERRSRLTQNTRIHNLTGCPAISLPVPNTVKPVGLQLAAQRGRDGWLVGQAVRIGRSLAG